MVPQCSQLVPPAWFSNTLGGTHAPAHAPAQATRTMLIGHGGGFGSACDSDTVLYDIN